MFYFFKEYFANEKLNLISDLFWYSFPYLFKLFYLFTLMISGLNNSRHLAKAILYYKG